MYCNYDSLHFTNESCIVRCRQCGSYKIAFLSLVISLPEDEYRDLYGQVSRCYDEGHMDAENTARNLFFAIPSKDIHLMLTAFEATRLYNMMEEADCEMKSLELIAMFEA